MPESVIDITTSTTLQDIERTIAALPEHEPVQIRLARNHYKNFFKDTWLTSLITNAAMKSRHLTIHDWKASDVEDMRARFAGSLVGLLAVYMAQALESDTQHDVTIDVHEMIEEVIYDKRGFLEQSEGGGKAFSFLSFDAADEETGFPNAPRPLVLSASDKSEFIEKFLRIKREKIDTAFGIKAQLSLFGQTYENERALAVLIYELYENTNQHGRYDANNSLIKGVRSFSIKRHIGKQKDILEQAGSFSQLQDYFELFENKHDLRFYEISISDSGLGIVDRFISSRPDYQMDTVLMELTSLDKLNYIIEKSLSSKLFAGSGKGIRTALSIIANLDGFLTLRTNDCWVYYNGRMKESSLQLNSVSDSNDIAHIRGTFYNILLPVSNL